MELHFLHYKSFDEAYQTWNRRKKRMNLNNLFVMWTFMGEPTDPRMAERFERLPFRNKIAFSERSFDEYSSIYQIKGYEDGLGVLTLYDNLKGKRIVDQFDFVCWLNDGEID